MNNPSAPPAEGADRILLVDDDVTNLDVLRHTLDGRGYRLFVTRSGESAIEVARRVRPLLILNIKPQNLFLCRLGLDFDVLKVLDFGLVKSLDDNATQLTAAGMLTGTPAYMPPERVLGATADERSDLYSLGCVAYWMLTGQPVFSGEPMAVIIHHARTAPTPPSTVSESPIPDALEQIVLACLEKAPEKRPSSALDLWRQLGDVVLRTPWSPERAESWWRDHLPELATRSPDSDSSSELRIQPVE